MSLLSNELTNVVGDLGAEVMVNRYKLRVRSAGIDDSVLFNDI